MLTKAKCCSKCFRLGAGIELERIRDIQPVGIWDARTVDEQVMDRDLVAAVVLGEPLAEQVTHAQLARFMQLHDRHGRELLAD